MSEEWRVELSFTRAFWDYLKTQCGDMPMSEYIMQAMQAKPPMVVPADFEYDLADLRQGAQGAINLYAPPVPEARSQLFGKGGLFEGPKYLGIPVKKVESL